MHTGTCTYFELIHNQIDKVIATLVPKKIVTGTKGELNKTFKDDRQCGAE